MNAVRPPSAVIDYRFRQPFRLAARPAFDWATDFTEADWALAGINGRRRADRISPTMVRLTDRIDGPDGTGATKVRVVQLYPKTLSWVSTHVEGPCLHSQFRYSIARSGRRASVLTFQGREIRWESRRSTPQEVQRLSTLLRAEDATLWRRFAKVMVHERGSAE
jgi:hypothetical protein